MTHSFCGKWISNEELASLQPRNVFFRQLERVNLDCSQYRNRHVLFRKNLMLNDKPKKATLYITADDYYKLYVNGSFVAQGPAPSYHFQYNYNEIDLTDYLQAGKNVIAVHTLYQGLINRVWQSGDFRHGLLCDLVADGQTVLCSDESFLVATHSAYTEIGVTGYATQFLEQYDSRAREVGFEQPDFDDSSWSAATPVRYNDHTVTAQRSHMLVFEKIAPVDIRRQGASVLYDFGSNYVGYLSVTACGQDGQTITLYCGQELNEDGSLRHQLRANCNYAESWILADGACTLEQYDYKAFRYARLELPDGVQVQRVCLLARHYPFTLSTALRSDYAKHSTAQKIWQLCVNTQKYGVQEVIQDCMEREKGFYLGDGCYTALTHMILTGDDSMVRKLIDDAFASSFITDTLVTCMDCSFMQEIAEYPLIMVSLILWHYRLKGDKDYLRGKYPQITALLDAYRREYEHDGLLKQLNKWCVVEWPANFRHGYAVDIQEGKVCEQAHVSINAYYLNAIRTANRIASLLDLPPYRDASPLYTAFLEAFYDAERKLFKDGEMTDHISLVGNSFVYAFALYPDEQTRQNILALLDAHGMDSLSFFCTFPMLCGLCRDGEEKRVREALLNPGTWSRMLREDATTTFEGWGKDTKWNTSLFHLTMSFAAVFLADIDHTGLFA